MCRSLPRDIPDQALYVRPNLCVGTVFFVQFLSCAITDNPVCYHWPWVTNPNSDKFASSFYKRNCCGNVVWRPLFCSFVVFIQASRMPLRQRTVGLCARVLGHGLGHNRAIRPCKFPNVRICSKTRAKGRLRFSKGLADPTT